MFKYDKPGWVAVYTAARAEKQVFIRLLNAGFETFLPLVKTTHQWSDRVKLVEVPLFSSYVFVRINATQEVPLRNVAGVVTIVSDRERNIPVIPDDQIEAIRRLLEANQKLFVCTEQALHKGAMVTIQSGNFAGMHGMLISDCKEGNFSIRIEAIGFAIVTEIDRLLLKPDEI